MARKKCFTFASVNAEIAQSVEHQLPKLRAAGSNPVFRSRNSTDEGIAPAVPFFMHWNSRKFTSREWKGIKKERAALLLCPHPAHFLESAPAASGKGMPEAKSRNARSCRRPNPATHGVAGGQIPQRMELPEAKSRNAWSCRRPNPAVGRNTAPHIHKSPIAACTLNKISTTFRAFPICYR